MKSNPDVNALGKLDQAQPHVSAVNTECRTELKLIVEQRGIIVTDNGLELAKLFQSAVPVGLVARTIGLMFSEKPPVDVWQSLHTYHAPNRKKQRLAKLCCMHVGFKINNLTFDRTYKRHAAQILLSLEEQGLPQPTGVIYLGRGLQLIWDIKPIPATALPRWEAVQTNITQSLNHFHPCWKQKGQSTITRILGSVNSNPALHIHNHLDDPSTASLKSIVQSLQFDLLHIEPYSFEELAKAFLPRGRDDRQKTKPKKKKASRKKGFPARTVQHLCYARLKDLKILQKNRSDQEPDWKRQEHLFFIAANIATWINEVEGFTLKLEELAKELVPNLFDCNVKRISNAALDRLRRSKPGGTDEPRLKFSNQHIIEKLGITLEEQRKLQTIFSRYEKNRRRCIRDGRKRAKKGMQRQADINAEADKRRQAALKLRSEEHSWARVAELVGYKNAESARKSCSGHELRLNTA